MTLYVALVGGWALLITGVAHLLRPGALRWHLRSQGLVSLPVARTIAWLLPPFETLLGGALLGAFLTGQALLWRPLSAVGAALTAGYGLYLLALRRRGFEGECGCGPGSDDVGAYTVARAFGLAGGLCASSLAGLRASVELTALLGRPLLVSMALVGALLVLVARAGWAHSRRVLADLQRELAWDAAERPER